MELFFVETTLPVDVPSAFAYHERPGALDRLMPPWKDVRVVSSDGSLHPGSRVVMRLGFGPLGLRWVAEHEDYVPPELFSDRQVSGPFASWLHRHRFVADRSGACLLQDDIQYRLPFGALGRLMGDAIARRELTALFSYRHHVTEHDLHLQAKYNIRPKRIAVSGASGLVGKQLVSVLRLLGHDVSAIVRSVDESADDDSAIAPWGDPAEAEKLCGFDAVIHLAGAPIAARRWTDSVKREIRESRTIKTRELASALAACGDPPSTLLCASAVGIYGSRGDTVLNEQSDPGDDFLADVAIEWEQACQPARDAGVRVANARFGLILDPRGGALRSMLLPAKFFGGTVGSGRQWWSWIAMDDVIGAIVHALEDTRVEGPFNVTAPHPVTAKEFARTLGRVIGRPAIFPAPAPLLRLALGEMADGLLLGSQNAIPSVLTDTDYEFRFSDLEGALRHCLGRPG